jgi:glutathione S-transferase
MNGGRDLSSSSLVLYEHPASTSPTIIWAGYEVGLDLVMGNPMENPHPYGKVPCLTDQNGKIMVFENEAILQYLQNQYDKNKNGQGGGDRDSSYRSGGRESSNSSVDEGEVSRWIEWASASLEPICLLEEPTLDSRRGGSQPSQLLQSQQPKVLQHRTNNMGQPRQQPLPQPRREIGFYSRQGLDFEELEELNKILGQKQRQLEQRLQEPQQSSGGRVVRDAPPSSCFLVGNEFTLADVAVASLLLYIPQNFPGTNLSQWPYLVRYMKDCAKRPGYASSFGPDVQAFVLDELNFGPRGGPSGGGTPRPPPPSSSRGPSGLGRTFDEDDRRRGIGERRLFTPSRRY